MSSGHSSTHLPTHPSSMHLLQGIGCHNHGTVKSHGIPSVAGASSCRVGRQEGRVMSCKGSQAEAAPPPCSLPRPSPTRGSCRSRALCHGADCSLLACCCIPVNRQNGCCHLSVLQNLPGACLGPIPTGNTQGREF